MYTLSCKDMGIETCDFVAKGETPEETMAEAAEHFKAEHPKEAEESMQKYSKEEMDKMMMDKIREM